jgi:predicted transcriptional regulator
MARELGETLVTGRLVWSDEGVPHLPVICNKRLVGLVSIRDVVKHQLAECQYEHSAMREYIATG